MALEDVAGFSPPKRERQVSTPAPSSPEGQTSPSRVSQATDTPKREADPQPDLEPQGPGGLQGRLHRLREMASGSRRPLGSPEGPATNPRSTSPSRGSVSNPRRIVENAALSIRQGSIWADWLLGRWRPDCDFVATAEESYAIAAPLAGWIVDRIPETGPIAELAENAGLVGAGAATATYLVRAGLGKPGGRQESEALRERVLRRMHRAKSEQEVAAQQAEATQGDEQARAPRHSLAGMLGDDEDEPIGFTVPV